jgi:hypothetical protein
MLLLTGCASNLRNLTSSQLPSNPSGIYTFSVELENVPGNLVEGSETVTITIDGQADLRMSPSPISDRVWRYEYRIPPEKDLVGYFYTVRYQVEKDGEIRDREITSDRIYYSELVNRYILGLEVDRGPVGTEVAVLGRNFSPGDRVEIGGVEAETRYESPTSLRFVVPALDAGRSYEGRVLSDRGDLTIGRFRIDAAELEVLPGELELTPGGMEMMIFSTPTPAPSGGLPIRVTTDVPGILIMPEVVVPAGQRSVNVRVEGGEPGEGTVYVEAPGYSEVRLPVRVSDGF